MKLFIAKGFVLEPSAVDFHKRVLALGKQAEKEVLDFLRKREITSRGSTAVGKRLQAGAIQDPDRQDLLESVAAAL
ncbi:hypothetical protein PC129_g4035 [Phytophthora cactorum]|uniref:Uncharacterized protein n=1 Tax=Phytophthora cactorum TaxID=29920 RepID=A0A329R5G2_9STRA|nr:hypothetical protein Pcac1_g3240 [Phytophthora cactorum]KAG2792689.1 hypothetical protein PC113_g25642 [Phytophthora cactorum]KAG2795333.1 hypothetical protein PC111_g22191 [Phytophthora cactorum]KAG2795653.1 hypothetical protein PC112_g22540 [Phytophthora cactorum]KAG2879786.1 hypothetical protein PC114_g22394 [Phytophthora cactorum]